METFHLTTGRIRKCCVPNCEDKTSMRHSFPQRDTELFRKWIEKVNNPILNDKTLSEIYRTYRVCHSHFVENFKVEGTKTCLTKTAYPTLKLPKKDYLEASASTSVEEICEYEDTSSSRNIHNIQLPTATLRTISPIPHSDSGITTLPTSLSIVDKSSNIEYGSPSTSVRSSTPVSRLGKSSRCRILREVDITRQRNLSPKARHMYQQVIAWGNKVYNLQRRITSYRSRLENAENLNNSPKFANLMEYLHAWTYNFILSQIRTQNLPPKGKRFTMDDKILALSLLKASHKGYRLLSKIFSLPSRRTLMNLLNKIHLRPGINEALLEDLKEGVLKMKDQDKYCIVTFDEMSLDCNVQYNKKEDCIEGIQDLGDIRSPYLADYANTFLVKGVYTQWKQPLSFTFTNGPVKTVHLKKLIIEAIESCQQAGLKVM